MYLPSSGMPRRHFDQFQLVAQELGLIIIVRNTNPKSTLWIERGYPPKPVTIKYHTSEKTGKVTAANPAEVNACRAANFYVIDADGIARRGPNDALPGSFPFGTGEQNEKGQVIDPKQKKALVGDYDLMGVVDPQAKGRNLTLVWSNGVKMYDFTSPDVDRVRMAVNARLDQPRIMHGAQDQFADFPLGGATAFLRNGLGWELKNEQSIREFYTLLGRETIQGSYVRQRGLN
jgi:hypothetical protein